MGFVETSCAYTFFVENSNSTAPLWNKFYYLSVIYGIFSLIVHRFTQKNSLEREPTFQNEEIEKNHR